MKHTFNHGGEALTIDLTSNGDGYLARYRGQDYDVSVRDLGDGDLEIRIDGRLALVRTAPQGDRRWVALNGRIFELSLASGGRREGGAAAEAGMVRAPMPGQVRALSVEVGEQVHRGQLLLLLEAMKMEIRIQAPADGIVAALPVDVGAQVDVDQVLVEIR